MDAIRTIMTLTAAFLAISCSGLRKAAGSEEKVSVACAAEIDYSGAGTADIDITASVPEGFRNPNTGIILVPALVSKDGSRKMPLLSCIAEGSLHNTFNGRNDIYEPDLSDSISWTFMRTHIAAGCSFLLRHSRFLQRTRMLLRIWNSVRNIFMSGLLNLRDLRIFPLSRTASFFGWIPIQLMMRI